MRLTAFMCLYLKSVVFLVASGTYLYDFVVFLDEVVDSSDEEETDGNYSQYSITYEVT